MALNWKSVSAEHVQQACTLVAKSHHRAPKQGLVVWNEGQCLPAKDVLREAYRLANRLSTATMIRFSSGDATLNTLRNAGFRAERLTPKAETASVEAELSE